MPISSSLDQIKTLIDGVSLSPSAMSMVFEGLEFDSREIRGGELFIALPGDNSHGNQFVEVALSRGASVIVADKNSPLPEITEKERVLLVDQPLKAFWKIAAWWRDQIKLPTFAVTGSVGKTTVKEMVASILLQKGVGTYSLKSHNNHVGVPYTICRASRDHHWLVLEIGMNHRGEIAPLSELAQPQVAAVTNIAPAHIGQLGSIEVIADEKLEILKGLSSAGHLLLNAQSQVLLERFKSLRIPDGIICHLFGVEVSGDGGISNIKSMGLEGISFDCQIAAEVKKVTMRVLGRQNAWNAACAALAAQLTCPDISAEQIVKGLSRFTAPLMRLNIKYLSDASVLIDDSYNANPASMTCAIELLSDLKKDGQKIGLVIGDMLELGSFSEFYHKEIAEVIERVCPDFVIAVGQEAKHYIEGAERAKIPFKYCLNVNEALQAVKGIDFTYLLVKASRGIGLDKVVSELISSRGELPYEPQLSSDSDS